jgi:hypothetical protein
MSDTVRTEKALALLEHPESYPGLPGHAGSRLLLRVWRYPSFTPYFAWAVIASRDVLFLRRVVWDQAARILPTPRTFGCEIPLQKGTFEPIMARLRTIQIPPFLPVPTIGLDGTSYGVEYGDFILSCKLTWWETPPVEWTPLQQWHTATTQLFESLLPTSTPAHERAEP